MSFTRAAGTNGKPCGSAKDCLKFEERPSTPPEIAMYRKSNSLAPGVRFQHHGTAADYAAKNLHELTFGECTDRGNNTAASLISRQKICELESMNLRKSEKVYKSQAREPLGRSLERGAVLPTKFTHDGQAFGVSSNIAQPAKEIIFPVLEDGTYGAEDVYKKSHGAIGPGEQISRGYNWHGEDMDKKIFGIKGNSLAFNGVSQNVAEAMRGGNQVEQHSTITRKTVEDFRDTADQLGRIKNLGQQDINRPADLPFGMPSGAVRSGGRPRLSAQSVMKGNYTEDDNMPDKDLGRSLTPGFRNTGSEDDVTAQYLVNPPIFANLNISAGALDEAKDRNQIFHLFSRIGYNLHPTIFEVIFNESAGGRNECTVNQFRDILNDYLSALDVDKENEWLRSKGRGP